LKVEDDEDDESSSSSSEATTRSSATSELSELSLVAKDKKNCDGIRELLQRYVAMAAAEDCADDADLPSGF
jgi:hypothetical protein